MKLEPGTVWTHYKGKRYIVLHLACIESSGVMDSHEGTLVVVYSDIHDDNMVFVRPAAEWTMKVSYAAKKVPRFEFFAETRKVAESRMRCE